jgi:hypothetical protein
MKMSGYLQTPAALLPLKNRRYPQNRNLGRLDVWEKKTILYPGQESNPTPTPVTIPITLPLTILVMMKWK